MSDPMRVTDPMLSVIAEIMTKETAEEKAAVLQKYRDDLASWQKWVVEHDNRNIARWRERDEKWAALPWWKRVGRRPPLP